MAYVYDPKTTKVVNGYFEKLTAEERKNFKPAPKQRESYFERQERQRRDMNRAIYDSFFH